MHPVTFFRAFINSLSSPKYYIDVLNAPLAFSIRFLVMGYVFLAVIASVIFVTIDAPKLRQSLTSFINASVQDFPENRTISWTGIQLETNLEETYTLPFPQFPDAPSEGMPTYLLQFNPAVQSVEQITEYTQGQSFFFIGKNTLFAAQPNGGWSDLVLTDVLPTSSSTISKESLTDSLPVLHQQLNRGLSVLPLLFVAFFLLISFPLRLIGVLVDTIFIFLVMKLFGLPLGAKKVIQISLHIMVIAELITILTANFSQSLPMFTITFWGYTILIYWQIRNIKAFSISELADREKQ